MPCQRCRPADNHTHPATQPLLDVVKDQIISQRRRLAQREGATKGTKAVATDVRRCLITNAADGPFPTAMACATKAKGDAWHKMKTELVMARVQRQLQCQKMSSHECSRQDLSPHLTTDQPIMLVSKQGLAFRHSLDLCKRNDTDSDNHVIWVDPTTIPRPTVELLLLIHFKSSLLGFAGFHGRK